MGFRRGRPFGGGPRSRGRGRAYPYQPGPSSSAPSVSAEDMKMFQMFQSFMKSQAQVQPQAHEPLLVDLEAEDEAETQEYEGLRYEEEPRDHRCGGPRQQTIDTKPMTPMQPGLQDKRKNPVPQKRRSIDEIFDPDETAETNVQKRASR